MKVQKVCLARLLMIGIAGFSNLAVLSSLAQITVQPADQSVNIGGTATFAVADATATAYQWQLNGVNLANGGNANGSTYTGATSATLTISGVTPQDAAPAAAGYACFVTDGNGNSTSSPAALVVRLVRFAFDEPNTGSSYFTASDSDSGVSTSLAMLNGSASPADYHGAADSGVNGIGRAFDSSTNASLPDGTTTGPIAWGNGAAALGFKTLSNFTVTTWFKLNPGATTLNDGRNPRLCILGPAGTTDTTVDGAFGIKLGSGDDSVDSMKANLNNTDLPVADGVAWTNGATGDIWYFLALAYDGSTLTYYSGGIDGVANPFHAHAINAILPIGTNGTVMIGNRTSDFTRFLPGWIDDVRFFSGTEAGLVENARLLAISPGPAVTAFVMTNNHVALSWTPFDSSGMTGPVTYNVKRATTSGGPYTLVANGAGVIGTEFTDTTATFGHTYYYAVAPFNSAGEGNPGPEASAAITTGGITAVLNPNKSVTLNFVGTAGVQYHLQVAGNVAVVPVQWSDVPGSASLASGMGAWSFTDVNTAGFSPRFYRTVSP